jgi:transcriptional regulator with XRE-family HTH domain
MRIAHNFPAKSPGQVFAQRLAEVRRRVDLSQQELADRVSELGYKMAQPTVARIEKGGTRAENVSLKELLVFAFALGVCPTNLFTPLDEETRLEITPQVSALPRHARDWIRGTQPYLLEELGEETGRIYHVGDPRVYYTEVPDVELPGTGKRGEDG